MKICLENMLRQALQAWHTKPGRIYLDRVQTRGMVNAGYLVRRFTDKDILKSVKGCVDSILLSSEHSDWEKTIWG